MFHLRYCALLFIFLIYSSHAGNSKKRKSHKGRGMKPQEPFYPGENYSVSATSVSWNEAKNECELIFGERGTLASVETEEELELIKQVLRVHGDTGSYWIGGYYNAEKNKFLWVADNTEVPDGKNWKKNPWAKELPDVKTIHSRMFIDHVGSHTTWSFTPATRYRKYLCEIQTEGGGGGGGPACKNKNADVVFALDVSYSMRDSIKDATSFIKDIVTVLKSFDGNQVALFLYTEEEVYWIFKFRELWSTEQYIDKIDAIEYNYTQGESHIFAMQTAMQHFRERPRKQGTSLKSIVLLTDGETEPEQSNTIDVAKGIVNQGIKVFAIKVLTEKIEEEPEVSNLPAITGGEEERVFELDDQSSAAAAICSS